MENEKIIEVPKWILETIEDTLQIEWNNGANKLETCQDRNIKESLNFVRKLLKGEEITGMERLEKLVM